MECNCNNNNSNGGVIPWVRGNRLPLIICVYENVVTQEQVGDSTLTVNEMTRVPYTIQDNDTVTVIMKSGFRQVEMPFTTDGNKVMVTDNGELPTGAYTVEVTIERGDGARGRWQETRQVRIYENTSDAQLGEMYSIDADLFFYAKGDTGTGIADITNNPDGTLTITMTDGTSYTTEALKGDKGDKGDTGERGVSIVSFDVTGQTDVSVIYTVTFSDDTTQDISVPKGPQGDTGLTGNGISTTTLNSDYTLTIAYTDGTTYTTPSIRGAQGAQGVSVIGFTQTGETATNTMYNLVFSDGRTQSVAIPKGVKGDKGDKGDQGIQGIQGPKGDTVTATDYTLYNVQGSSSEGAMSQDATTKAISAQTGYYTCGTAAGTAEKVVTVENGNLYKRTLGGHFKVKMTNKNTAASGVTLQIGSETAAALRYNETAVSASNTWDAGEVISVYYDGSVYQASNVQGGGGSAVGKKKLSGVPSTVISFANSIADSTVPVGTAQPSQTATCIEQKVEEGDVIMITAQGGGNARAWGFIDSNRLLLSYEDANKFLKNKVVVAPAGATKIILNAVVSGGTGYPNYEWYFAKAGSVGAHEMLTEAYIYGGLKTLAIGQNYYEGECVQTDGKELLRVTKEIKQMSITDEVSVGGLRTYNGNTFKSLKDVNAYSIDKDADYADGDYAIGSPAGVTVGVEVDNPTEGKLSVTFAGVTMKVNVTSESDAASVAHDLSLAFGNQEKWALIDNGDGTLELKSKYGVVNAPSVAPVVSPSDAGVSVTYVANTKYTGSTVLSQYDGSVWSEATLANYAGDTGVWGTAMSYSALKKYMSEDAHSPKLYDDFGLGVDGAVSQKCITNNLTVLENVSFGNQISNYIGENGQWKTNGYHYLVPIEVGKKYILSSVDNLTYYAWLRGTETSGTPSYAGGLTMSIFVEAGTENLEITPPHDAKYLYLLKNVQSLSYPPSKLEVYSSRIDRLEKETKGIGDIRIKNINNTDLNYSDLAFSDENNYDIVRFVKGHVWTKNFFSADYVNTLNFVKNKFNGKRLAIIGDSISSFVGTSPQGYAEYYNRPDVVSDVTNVNYMWWKIVSDTLGLSPVNCSWSASTVRGMPKGSTAVAGCSDKRIEDAGRAGAPDFIIYYIGCNDWGLGIPLGNWTVDTPIVDDSSYTSEQMVSTFKASYALMLKKARVMYPAAKIYCCTILDEYLRDVGGVDEYPPINAGGVSNFTWNQNIKEIAEALGASVIDVHDCGVSYFNLSNYSSDGSLHPNKAGHALIAEKVISQLISK